MTDLFDYIAPPTPEHIPYARGSDTSEAAAASIEPSVGFLRRQVLDAIAASPTGLTTDQVEERTNLPHQTASPRVIELRKGGFIRATGEKRRTRRNRNADVYQATGAGL